MRIPIICSVFHLLLSTAFHIVVRSFGVPSTEEVLICISEVAGEIVGEPGSFVVLNSILATLSITPESGSGGEKAQLWNQTVLGLNCEVFESELTSLSSVSPLALCKL